MIVGGCTNILGTITAHELGIPINEPVRRDGISGFEQTPANLRMFVIDFLLSVSHFLGGYPWMSRIGSSSVFSGFFRFWTHPRGFSHVAWTPEFVTPAIPLQTQSYWCSVGKGGMIPVITSNFIMGAMDHGIASREVLLCHELLRGESASKLKWLAKGYGSTVRPKKDGSNMFNTLW